MVTVSVVYYPCLSCVQKHRVQVWLFSIGYWWRGGSWHGSCRPSWVISSRRHRTLEGGCSSSSSCTHAVLKNKIELVDISFLSILKVCWTRKRKSTTTYVKVSLYKQSSLFPCSVSPLTWERSKLPLAKFLLKTWLYRDPDSRVAVGWLVDNEATTNTTTANTIHRYSVDLALKSYVTVQNVFGYIRCISEPEMNWEHKQTHL